MNSASGRAAKRAAVASVSDQTIELTLPGSGRIASGPGGMKN